MGKNVIQIHGGITINVDVDAKKFVYVKKNMFGILVNVFVRMENIQQVLRIINLMITCDEVISSYHEKIKTVSTNFNEKKVTSKT